MHNAKTGKMSYPCMTDYITSVISSFVVLVAICLLVPAGSAREEDREVSDTAVRNAVEDACLLDAAVPLNEIDVDVRKGVVRLQGTVRNILAKERATRIARTIKGVKAVVNTITIVPPESRTDRTITEDIEEALRDDPATESFAVNAGVEDGLVTLSGTLDSYQEKQLAAAVAKGVRGVTGLKNEITVTYDTNRTDREITQEIEQALQHNVLVDHALIDVSVTDAVVTLSGTIGSAAEKNEALTTAWVTGVKDVDGQRLDVARWARDEDLRKRKYVVKPDAQIEQAVQTALTMDPRVAPFEISVEVKGGTALLHGTVSNLKAKHSAGVDARNTVGVLQVKNRIKVKPPYGFSDAEIKENVRDALARNPYIGRYEISITVDAGIVELTGSVDSYFDKSQAEDVASRAPGVKNIQNRITVLNRNRPLTYSPYVGPLYRAMYDWPKLERVPPIVTDQQIKENIENEFFWSPFVDGGDIKIEVEDGDVTLKGAVDTLGERQAATENAYQGGAVQVHNQLDIE